MLHLSQSFVRIFYSAFAPLQSIAASYAPQVVNFATASSNDHLELSYGDSSSWGLAYNLYAQRLLGFSLFPDSVFEMQTSWYSSHVNTYGIPLDTRHTYTKSDWTIWTAAIASDTTTRDLLIGRLATWAADGIPNQPFSDFYETETGDAVRNNVGDESFRNRWVLFPLPFLFSIFQSGREPYLLTLISGTIGRLSEVISLSWLYEFELQSAFVINS